MSTLTQRENARTVHELKTLAPYWDAVERGDKTFEVRRDDRGFQRGDILKLKRIDPKKDLSNHDLFLDIAPTITKRISYVLTGGQLGIEPGFVVLGLADPEPHP